jgi:hypothetical protein
MNLSPPKPSANSLAVPNNAYSSNEDLKKRSASQFNVSHCRILSNYPSHSTYYKGSLILKSAYEQPIYRPDDEKVYLPKLAPVRKYYRPPKPQNDSKVCYIVNASILTPLMQVDISYHDHSGDIDQSQSPTKIRGMLNNPTARARSSSESGGPRNAHGTAVDLKNQSIRERQYGCDSFGFPPVKMVFSKSLEHGSRENRRSHSTN